MIMNMKETTNAKVACIMCEPCQHSYSGYKWSTKLWEVASSVALDAAVVAAAAAAASNLWLPPADEVVDSLVAWLTQWTIEEKPSIINVVLKDKYYT